MTDLSFEKPVAVVVLAAGKGTRMKSDLPKVLHRIAGRPLVNHALDAAATLHPERNVVVVGPGMEAVAEAVAPADIAIQEDQLGTGDAMRAAMPALAGFAGTVLVLYGDTPLIRPETLFDMVRRQQAADAPAVVVLGFRPAVPGSYGRLIADGEKLEAIVEAKDATPAQLAVGLCNSGVLALDGRHLPALLARLSNDNAKGEYYLTDLVAHARQDGLSCTFLEAAEGELLGVNDRAGLAQAEAEIQARLRARAMAGGVTMVDPESVFLAADTVLGRDVVIEPNVVFGPGVTVADNVTIRAFCHIEGTTIGSGATVGPFARLRPGASLAEGARVGNFVEVKNATLGPGAKANHLTYIGDAEIGAGANIGAGTITCNYDGYLKHKTIIGPGAFIGSNTALVAPVTVGEGAIVGAGSTITRDVAKDALAVTRAEQQDVPRAAERIREKKAAEKAAKKTKQR